MNYARLLVNILLLALLPYWAFAQAPEVGDELDLEGILVESAMGETNGTSLILDNSRTKVGRDFYDLFYKHWSVPTQADSTQRRNAGPTDSSGDVVIMIEEIPSPGTANQILISIDDQPVWQQFVQGRYELLEADAHDAVDIVRQYLTAYQETQQPLGTQDQKGSGVH
ncbi:CsgE family curli-type amyloid fiber assembly protein [Spirosoma arcticum]